LILDATYILPLAKIGVDTDVLLAIAEKRISLKLDEVAVSLISIFELQAKAAKLRIPADVVSRSIHAILESFEVYSFSDPKVIELSFALRRQLNDYIDCVIVATAVARQESLMSEDSRIWRERKSLSEKYGLNVSRYRDVLKEPPR
jgi:PIN domain nuclease of toxin-antitoxin system